MNKKLAHIILFFGNFFCFWGLWYGYNDLHHTLMEITNQVDSISIGNRDGFFILAIGFPLIYIFIIIEHFRPDFINKYKSFMNQGAIVMVIALLFAGFIGSSWIKSKVENAGYFYCRNASGISALAKTLVYTKNIDICEELVASKRKNQ